MKTYIILLRGVTPTGKNKVPMAALRDKLQKAKLHNVRTYIQSGNVLAQTNLTRSEVERLVHDVIKKNFGGDLAVVAKTPAQFRTILRNNPFREVDTSRLYFSMFASKPRRAEINTLLSHDFFPELIEVVGDVLYTLYAAKHSYSKFNNNWFERKLKVAMTTRNFNTMTALVKLTSEEA